MRDTGMRRPYGLIVLLIAMLVLISGIAVARPTWIELPQQAVEEGRDGGTEDDSEAEEDGFFPTLPTTGEGTAPGGDPEDEILPDPENGVEGEPEAGPPFAPGGLLPTGPGNMPNTADGDGLDEEDNGPPFGTDWTPHNDDDGSEEVDDDQPPPWVGAGGRPGDGGDEEGEGDVDQ